MKPLDKNCNEDREVLCRTMKILYRSAPDSICDHIRKNSQKFRIEKDELITKTNNSGKNKLNCNSIAFHIALFLAQNPKCYNALSEEVHIEFEKLTNYHQDTKILREVIYFCTSKSDIQSCFNMLINLDDIEMGLENGYSYDAMTIEALEEVFTDKGCFNQFIDAAIDYFGKSSFYDSADNRYNTAIKPYLDRMDENQLKHLLDVSNGNDQIYKRRSFAQTFNEIKSAIGNKNIDLSKYRNLSSIGLRW